MGYEEAKKSASKPHNLILEDRKKLSVSGVEAVDSFDDDRIVMQTLGGELFIKGSELKIDRLSLETGEVSIQGLVSEIGYEETAPSGSLWTKLFH